MREPDKTWPKKFDVLLVRPFLMANFHAARLYGKLISLQVRNFMLNRENLKFIE